MSALEVPKRYLDSHRDWRNSAIWLQRVTFLLGVCAIGSSILVAGFTNELGDCGTRVVAALSALSVGLLAYFQIPKKIEDNWKGWKHLNTFIPLFEAGKIDLERFAIEYARAEGMVGVMEVKADSIGVK